MVMFVGFVMVWLGSISNLGFFMLCLVYFWCSVFMIVLVYVEGGGGLFFLV